MRLVLLLALLLSACAAPAPADDPITIEMDDADPMVDPRMDARNGLIAEALVGDWTIVTGPWESVTFEDDDTARFYANDRLMDSGEWSVEEGTLYVVHTDGSQTNFEIGERRVSGMTFTGPDGPFVVERIDG